MRKQLKFLTLTVLALVSLTASGQENTRMLYGKVNSPKNDVSDILIINLNSKKSKITDSLGLFSIEVKVNDSLRFTAVQYLTKEIIVTDSLLNENVVVIKLVENVINLNEVTVTPYNLTGRIDLDIDRLNIKPTVTSSSLGLPNADVDKMTQSERLLLEADRGKYIRLATIEDQGKLLQVLGYASIAVVINTHKIMNRLSGRTKSFEDMVARDENMELEQEIIAKFSKETLSDGLDIPDTIIDAFLSYCMAQEDFSKVLGERNTELIWDYLKARSTEFKQMEVSDE